MGWMLTLVVCWTATATLSMVLVATDANRRGGDALFWGIATLFSGVVGALVYLLVRLSTGGEDRSVGSPITPHRRHRDQRR